MQALCYHYRETGRLRTQLGLQLCSACMLCKAREIYAMLMLDACTKECKVRCGVPLYMHSHE